MILGGVLRYHDYEYLFMILGGQGGGLPLRGAARRAAQAQSPAAQPSALCRAESRVEPHRPRSEPHKAQSPHAEPRRAARTAAQRPRAELRKAWIGLNLISPPTYLYFL